MAWKKQTAAERIEQALADCGEIEVADLVRETDLNNLPLSKAYRVRGAHIYVAVTNAAKLLHSDDTESERSHRRFLRFLHVYQRVAHTDVFSRTDAVKVDFHNERLHFIVYRPYDSEKKRIVNAIAVGAAIACLLEGVGAFHDELPDAHVSVGIESGTALALSNGTRGDRESLFVGHPANHAAHLLGGRGVYLGEAGRQALGMAGDPAVPLTDEELGDFTKRAELPFDAEELAAAWREELADALQGDFVFTRPAPPLRTLDMEALTPNNSRRLETGVIVADVDGFTAFVDAAEREGWSGTAIQILHAARKELRDVLGDFGGRKVRYVGDSIYGVLAEGTAYETDMAETCSSSVVCAAAMRSSFDVLKEKMPLAATLGLSIGIELGPVSLSRVGVQGSRHRCAIGRAVIAAERLQQRSKGTQTRLGTEALAHASRAIRDEFPNGVSEGLGFGKVIALLKDADEPVARFGVEPVATAPISYPRAHTK